MALPCQRTLGNEARADAERDAGNQPQAQRQLTQQHRPSPPTSAATHIGRSRSMGIIITVSAIVVMNSSDQSRGIAAAPNTPTMPQSCQSSQQYTDGTM